MKSISPILNVFGRSPIKPLQKHMAKAHDAAHLLVAFFKATFADDWQAAGQIQQRIDQIESEADQLKRDLRLHLPKGLFLPVPRTDVLEILALQDRIANQAEDIAGLVIGRRMRIPAKIEVQYMVFLERCLAATVQAHKAINELDELLETGFKGNEVKLVEQMILELDKIEHDTDTLQIEVRQALFQIESELPPVDVVFLYKVLEWTGDLADRSQMVGGQLHLLLAR
jgi:predicted phosphate transport protein (TIGR00153 family)